MDSYEVLGITALVIVLVGQAVLLFLQVSMLRRYGHLSFLMLAVGTFLGMLYSAVSLLPLFVQFSESSRLLLFQCATASVVVGVIVGVSGTIGLFRSYRALFQLAQQVPQAST